MIRRDRSMDKINTSKLADYLRDQARWREQKAQEWEDGRNERSARALLEAAEYVETLDDNDKRIRTMERAKYFMVDVCTPGEEGENLVRTWNFHQYTGDPADLVNDLAKAAAERDYWEALSDEELKVAENRLRRVARRQGLILQKSRRRDFQAYDYGGWMIVDAQTNSVVDGGSPMAYGLSLADVESHLSRR